MPSSTFACEQCNKHFNANFTLRRHVKQHHPNATLPAVRRGRKPNSVGTSLVTCAECGDKLVNVRALYYHKRRVHNYHASSRSHARQQMDRRTMEFTDVTGIWHI